MTIANLHKNIAPHKIYGFPKTSVECQTDYTSLVVQLTLIEDASGNSIFAMIARHFCTDDCMDAGRPHGWGR
ncbi:MAG: hypothetical protein RL497_1963 [Pseudomonadota bacterium]